MNAEQKSPYRWVMAAIAGLLMTTSFISLTAFGILSSKMAIYYHVSVNELTILGIDSFSIGLFAAFFLGNGGVFNTRLKTGVLLAQLFLIVPQFLIPVFNNIIVLIILRFLQGLMIMMLALFSIQLEGWFAPDERAKSLAFTLGAISLGSAAGGLLGVAFRSFSWQESYYVTGVLMLVGAIIYFALAKDSPEQKKEFIQEEKVKHESAWKNPMTWVMGIIQIPLSWTLFSIGGYLSTYSRFLGYSISESGTLVIAWGLAGFAAAFIGAVLGDRLTRKTNTNMGILKARLKVMTLADVLMAVGIILMVALGHVSFYALLMAVIINGFLMMFPPNYWALPGNIFPLVIVTEGAFGMGLISNSADAIGPLVTSSIISTVGWTGVFMIMLGLAFLGIALNVFLAKSKIKVPEGKPE